MRSHRATHERNPPAVSAVPAGVPSAWPFGYGCISMAVGKDEWAGMLLVVGLPNEHIGTAGEPFEDGLFKSLWTAGGPRLILKFKDAEAVDRLTNQLAGVREAILAQGTEAGTDETIGLGPKGDGPVPQGCAQDDRPHPTEWR